MLDVVGPNDAQRDLEAFDVFMVDGNIEVQRFRARWGFVLTIFRLGTCAPFSEQPVIPRVDEDDLVCERAARAHAREPVRKPRRAAGRTACPRDQHREPADSPVGSPGSTGGQAGLSSRCQLAWSDTSASVSTSGTNRCARAQSRKSARRAAHAAIWRVRLRVAAGVADTMAAMGARTKATARPVSCHGTTRDSRVLRLATAAAGGQTDAMTSNSTDSLEVSSEFLITIRVIICFHGGRLINS